MSHRFPSPTLPPWAAGLPVRARRAGRSAWIVWCLAWTAVWVILTPLFQPALLLALLSLAAIFIGRRKA